MPNTLQDIVVVLGTGGTIAGTAQRASDNVGYSAAQVGVDQLLAGVPALQSSAHRIEVEQVAQVDSKDMDDAVWLDLLVRCVHHLQRPEVRALVITHGTDTMEETAFFLHLALGRMGLLRKAVVLTGAMRPASSAAADGPQNLTDAVAVSQSPHCSGVVVVFAGVVHHAAHVHKQYTYRVDAFGSGEAGPLGVVEEGRVRWLGTPPPCALPVVGEDGAGEQDGAAWLARMQSQRWPRVHIVLSHAGVSADVIDALFPDAAGAADQAAARGLVVAGTGNGTLHQRLDAAARRVQAQGVVVWRASRCPMGAVVAGGAADALPDAGGLSPVKARIALMLQLLERNVTAAKPPA